jgi:hypothetical protein
MTEIERIIEGRGGYDYLIRSISIVTLLYERGVLHEILEQGRITEHEIDERAERIRERYPCSSEHGQEAAAGGEETEPDEREQDEQFEMD